ncbi:hypothetical protein [Tepidicella xavieri]|uniref:Uncharacterized protein n=1 Tax=Tepidicella xavieri TaxID=360241 RepID=A0A4R6UF02_9BURK|nr:hypothetical protein [Tepidicella xavieri]TDQ43759.1 hypothetical protein DFR43_105109 [Tepidicella xavieri]
MWFFVIAVKLIAEIALLSLLGRWVLGAWLRRLGPAGAGQENVFLWVLDTLTRPFVVVAGWVTPRWIPRAHLPLVAFGLLAVVWLAALLGKIGLCVELGMEQCR